MCHTGTVPEWGAKEFRQGIGARLKGENVTVHEPDLDRSGALGPAMATHEPDSYAGIAPDTSSHGTQRSQAATAAGATPGRQADQDAATPLAGSWLLDPESQAILWADPQAIRSWQADNLGDLLDARFNPHDPMLLALKALSRRMKPGDSLVEGLRLMAGNRLGIHALCRIRAQEIRKGRMGLLVEMLGAAPDYTAPAGDGAPRRKGAPLSALITAIGLPLLIVDSAGRISAANPSAQRLLRRDQEALQGLALAELVMPEDRDGLSRILGNPGPTGGVSTLHLAPFTADEPPLPVELRGGPIEGSTPPRHCVLVRDLSEAHKTQADLTDAKEQAEAQNRRKTDFIARVSHELRTPLTAVIGFAELMLKGGLGPVGNPRYEAYARHVFEAGHHALSLVEDLLDLSRIETGRMVLDPGPVDVAGLITSCTTMVEPLAANSAVILEAGPPEDLPLVHGDGRSLRQVLLNILTNGIRHTPPGGKVSVTAHVTADGQVLVRVSDTGDGMSRETLEQVLSLTGTRRDGPDQGPSAGPGLVESKGLGLGLPLAKALAEANGAQLSLRSVQGEGTIVEVQLPREEAPV